MAIFKQNKRIIPKAANMYRFVYGTNVYTFTDHSDDVVFEDEVYTAATISSGEIYRSQNEPLKNNVDIEVTISNPLIVLWQTRANNVSIKAQIVELNLKDHTQKNYRFVGELNGMNGQNEKVILKGVDVREKLQDEIQTATYSRYCQIDQYGRRCTLDYEAWASSLTVVSINSQRNKIKVSSLPIDYQRYVGGMFKNSFSEVSAVLSIDFANMTIEIDEQLSFLTNAGDTVKIAPTCSYLVKNCKDKFNNVRNFHGHVAISSNVTEPGVLK